MNNLLSIGELAGYQNISKQTLIFYDRIGLFKPAYVDPDNHYRYYTAQQIDYLDTILFMKEMGFSLAEIQEHMCWSSRLPICSWCAAAWPTAAPRWSG